MPQPRSSGFDKACAGPHRIAQKVELLIGGVVQAKTPVYTVDPARVAAAAVGRSVMAGTVTQDRSQMARQSLDITFSDRALVPLKADSLLRAAGEELRVWRGIVLPNRATELMCQGTFGVQSVDWDDPFHGLHVTGTSRGRRVMDDNFEFPRFVYAGSAFTRLQQLLVESVPFARLSWDPDVADVDLAEGTYDSDRAGACDDIAAALGCELVETPLGGFHLQRIPDPAGDANVVLTDEHGGTIATAKRSVSRDNVANVVVVLGQTADGVTPSFVARDMDPYSETYVPTYGRKVARVSSPHIRDSGQAETAARARLLDTKGAARSVSITGATNPALLASDVARLWIGGRAEQHVIDKIVTPIGVGAQQMETRTARPDSTL